MKLSRTTTAIIIITIATIAISIAIPIVIYSKVYGNLTGDIAWTPAPSEIPTETLAASFTATPLQRPTHTFSPSSAEGSNCTYPTEYWIEHPEHWLELLAGNIMYTRDDVPQILSSQSQEVHDILLKQLYLAYLNIFSGADLETIENTLIEATTWLQTHSLNNQPTEEEHQIGIQLSQILLDFNNGIIGPGICPPYEMEYLTPEIIETATAPKPTATSTTTRFLVTLKPSATATKKTDNGPNPTNPPKPTNPPATNTIQPQPTSTNPPPELTKPPTSAPPEETPVHTAPPLPTDPPKQPTPTPAS